MFRKLLPVSNCAEGRGNYEESARMTHSLKSRKTDLDRCGSEINRRANSAWIVPQGRTWARGHDSQAIHNVPLVSPGQQPNLAFGRRPSWKRKRQVPCKVSLELPSLGREDPGKRTLRSRKHNHVMVFRIAKQSHVTAGQGSQVGSLRYKQKKMDKKRLDRNVFDTKNTDGFNSWKAQPTINEWTDERADHRSGQGFKEASLRDRSH